MELDFYRGLCEKLISSEFKIINGFYSGNELDQESLYYGMGKYTGASLCIVVPIRAAECSCERLKNIIRDLTRNINGLLKTTYANQIVFLCAVICENADRDIIDFADNEFYSENENIIEARWIIDIGRGEMIVGKNQPSKIAGIEKIIKMLLTGEEKEYAKSIEEAKQKGYEERKNELAGRDFNLTIGIFLINLIVFALMELNGGSENNATLMRFGALRRENIISGGEYYRFITSMFIHIGIMHLASNSLALYIFGKRIEMYRGKAILAAIYILSGICGGIVQILISEAICAGASGALFGLEGAMLGYCMRERKSIGGFDLYILIIFVFMGLSMGFMSEDIGNGAHLGGFICGFVLSFILRRKKKNA